MTEKPDACSCCDQVNVELIYVKSPVGTKDCDGWFCCFCRTTYAIRSYQYPDRYDRSLYVTLVRLAWGVAELVREDLDSRAMS